MEQSPTGVPDRSSFELARRVAETRVADLDTVGLPMRPLYQELRDLAARELGRERSGHTLQATALVHEAYLRLAPSRNLDWADHRVVLQAAARVMRRILVDWARARGSVKRGAGRERVTLTEMAQLHLPAVDVIALSETMEALAERNPRHARVVELRVFGGLTIEETASVLDIGTSTAERDWSMARAWLSNRLRPKG